MSALWTWNLYEWYSFESPLELVDGIKVEVKRQHCEATKGEWLNNKDAVWQHSQFPSSQAYTPSQSFAF